jgi:integration host factor subunit alpha
MTKADISAKIYEKMGTLKNSLSVKESSQMVNQIFDIIEESIVKEKTLKISGFGTFTVKEKAARRGRNPQTGESMTITPRAVLTFKASNILKETVSAQ